MKELTYMQAAYWVGRQSPAILGNVAAHLYAEFDAPDIAPNRLQKALEKLVLRHPMLCLKVDDSGLQAIDNTRKGITLDVDDIRAQTAGYAKQHLAQKRQDWTAAKLDLADGQACAFSLTRMPQGKVRLHVDTDMIAIDPRSFLIMMEDLARFYEDETLSAGPALPAYFDWLDRLRADTDLTQKRELDRQWWRKRLAEIPPAPPLPLRNFDAATVPQSDRLAAWLLPGERLSLETSARRCGITISTLALALFAAVLGPATKAKQFRLSVPMFWREPLVEQVDAMVGDFSNMVILGVDLTKANSYRQLCASISTEMTDLLAHSAYPGVNVMRDLSRHHGTMQLSPVVFTSGFGLPGKNLFSDRVSRTFGKMDWVISQGAQVALDAQIAQHDDGILINWDIRFEALPRHFIQTLFDDYVALLRHVANQPEHLDAPLPDVAADVTLTELMLKNLLKRLTAENNEAKDIAIALLGDNEQAELLGFINRYVPDAALTPQDLHAYQTPSRLARLLHARSGGASCAVARIFLNTVDAAA
jgi:Condensation domain